MLHIVWLDRAGILAHLMVTLC